MKKILVVDDSDVIRTIVEQTLKLHGYNDVLSAVDGEDGLQKLKANLGQVSLCVFDVNMPKMDGITLVQEMRKLDKTTPVIMLTTETDKAKMLAARDFGATGWIVKPFEGDKFIKVVEMYLKDK